MITSVSVKKNDILSYSQENPSGLYEIKNLKIVDVKNNLNQIEISAYFSVYSFLTLKPLYDNYYNLFYTTVGKLTQNQTDKRGVEYFDNYCLCDGFITFKINKTNKNQLFVNAKIVPITCERKCMVYEGYYIHYHKNNKKQFILNDKQVYNTKKYKLNINMFLTHTIFHNTSSKDNIFEYKGVMDVMDIDIDVVASMILNIFEDNTTAIENHFIKPINVIDSIIAVHYYIQSIFEKDQKCNFVETFYLDNNCWHTLNKEQLTHDKIIEIILDLKENYGHQFFDYEELQEKLLQF